MRKPKKDRMWRSSQVSVSSQDCGLGRGGDCGEDSCNVKKALVGLRRIQQRKGSEQPTTRKTTDEYDDSFAGDGGVGGSVWDGGGKNYVAACVYEMNVSCGRWGEEEETYS